MLRSSAHPSGRTGDRLPAGAVCAPIAAFLLTAAIWTAVLLLFGIAPFGKESLLITDLGQQYAEYHIALYDAVKSGGSLLYTWNGGLGMNFLGLFAYYLASPFTALILLFPRALLPEALLVIISLKIGGSAATMSIFLWQGGGVRGAANPIFSAMYALSGYTCAFFFNLMWFDAVFLLPLVLLGVRRVADGGRMMPLVAGYTVLFLSNYYAAYMAGVFSLLFLLALCYAKGIPLRESGRRMLRLLGAAAVAAGLGAFLLLPAFLALRESQGGAGLSLPWFGFTADPLSLLGKLSFGAYDSVTSEGTPNIYCGILSLGLLPVCLLHPGISRREKVAGGCLAGLLLLCMLIAPLDTLWHGGQPPVWFPCRYAFCLIFLFVLAAARAFTRPEGIPRPALFIGFGFSSLLMLAAKLPDWLFPSTAQPFSGRFVPTLALLIIYGGLLLFRAGKQRVLRWIALAALLVAVPLELAGNALSVFRSLDAELRFIPREEFTAYLDETVEQKRLLESAAAGDGLPPGQIYRVEDRTPRNPNDGLVRGLPALSHYSSLSRRATFRFLRHLGLTSASADKLLRYGGSTSALDALLGVRYVFGQQDPRSGMAIAVREDGKTGGQTLWRNDKALPLAYFADSAVLSVPAESEDGPFALQNALYSSLGGKRWETTLFYRPLTARIHCENGELISQAAYTRIHPTEKETWLEIAIENPTQQHVLLYFGNNLPENIAVLVNGFSLNPYGERLVRGVMDLGEQPAGTVMVTIPIPKDGYWLQEVYAVSFNEPLFDSLIDTLKQGAPSQIETAGSRASPPQVTLRINALRDGLLFTSIPCDEGWSAWVDGKKVPLQTVGDAFLAVPLNAGEHRVVLRFFPRGLTVGAGITGGTAILCIASAWIRRKQKPLVIGSTCSRGGSRRRHTPIPKYQGREPPRFEDEKADHW